MIVKLIRRSRKNIVRAIAAGCFVAGVVGCSGRPSVIPNPDPLLRKSTAEFAFDAAKRFPYKTDAPRGGETRDLRAQVGYGRDVVEISNFSAADWTDVEVWLNKSYVVHVPRIKANTQAVSRLDFQMFFDSQGHYFPTDNRERKDQISDNKIEIYRDGKMYDVPLQLAD